MKIFRVSASLAFGSAPEKLEDVKEFSQIVYCAAELPPPDELKERAMFVPLVDNYEPIEERLEQQALAVARALAASTLPRYVCCAQGKNRSAYVTALALCCTGETSKDALNVVRYYNPDSLSNEHFVESLLKLGKLLRGK